MSLKICLISLLVIFVNNQYQFSYEQVVTNAPVYAICYNSMGTLLGRVMRNQLQIIDTENYTVIGSYNHSISHTNSTLESKINCHFLQSDTYLHVDFSIVIDPLNNSYQIAIFKLHLGNQSLTEQFYSFKRGRDTTYAIQPNKVLIPVYYFNTSTMYMFHYDISTSIYTQVTFLTNKTIQAILALNTNNETIGIITNSVNNTGYNIQIWYWNGTLKNKYLNAFPLGIIFYQLFQYSGTIVCSLRPNGTMKFETLAGPQANATINLPYSFNPFSVVKKINSSHMLFIVSPSVGLINVLFFDVPNKVITSNTSITLGVATGNPLYCIFYEQRQTIEVIFNRQNVVCKIMKTTSNISISNNSSNNSLNTVNSANDTLNTSQTFTICPLLCKICFQITQTCSVCRRGFQKFFDKDTQTQYCVPWIYTDILLKTISFPNIKSFTVIFGSIFGFLDDFWLYEYHNVTYRQNLLQIFAYIRMVQQYQFIPRVIPMNYSKKPLFQTSNKRYIYTPYNYREIARSQINFLRVGEDMFLWGSLSTIAVYIVLHIIARLLNKQIFGAPIAKYKSFGFLLIQMFQKNVQYGSFLFFWEIQNFLMFDFENKASSALAIIYFFFLFIAAISLYIFFIWHYKNAKNLYPFYRLCAINNKKSFIYLTLIIGCKGIITGFIHSFLHFNYFMQMTSLMILNFGCLLVIILCFDVFEISFVGIINLLYYFFRFILNLLLLMDYLGEQIFFQMKIEKAQSLMIYIIIAWSLLRILGDFTILMKRIIMKCQCLKSQQKKQLQTKKGSLKIKNQGNQSRLNSIQPLKKKFTCEYPKQQRKLTDKVIKNQNKHESRKIIQFPQKGEPSQLNCAQILQQIKGNESIEELNNQFKYNARNKIMPQKQTNYIKRANVFFKIQRQQNEKHYQE